MKNMLENFIDYNPVKNVYKNQINNILLNAKEFYNRRKEVLIAFEENMFPLPKPYVFGENEWKERDLRKEEFMPKILKRSFLSELGYIPLSEKKDELLNKHFKFENIDELLEAFNNTDTKEEYNKLFDRISNQAIILKKLVKTVSNPVEKKRIKNVIKAVANILNYFLNKEELTESDSSNGLKFLSSNQMLSRLPLSLAQLILRNNS